MLSFISKRNTIIQGNKCNIRRIMDIKLEHMKGNLVGDNPYIVSAIPGHGMSTEPLTSKVQPVSDSAGGSQVVVIYAFHEAPADYDRFTPFFAETAPYSMFSLGRISSMSSSLSLRISLNFFGFSGLNTFLFASTT